MFAGRTRTRGCILMALVAFGFATRLSAEEAVLRDGRRLPGTLQWAANGRLQFRVRGQEKPLSLDQVEQVRFESRPPVGSQEAEGQSLLLRGGEQLSGALQTCEEDKVHWRTGWGQPIAVRRSEAAGVVRQSRERRPRPPADLTQDEVWLRTGDQLFGDLPRADPNTCVLKTRFGQRTIPWTDTQGLFFRQERSQPLRTEVGEQVRLALAEPQRDELEGLVRAFDEKVLRLQHPILGALVIPAERLRRLQGIVYGRLLYLDRGVHHLGRHVLATQEMPQPEGLILRRSFQLPDRPVRARLSVVATHLKGTGDGITAELARGALRTEVALNGKVVDYLNRHVDRLGGRPLRLTIPLPDNLLRRGENTLEVRQIVDPVTGRSEDCVFSNLVLELPAMP